MRIGIDESVSFFLLENEGIFFPEAQQELYAFNTPATFIWCCLEEGMSPKEIGGAFSLAFDVPIEQAAQTTSDLLWRWQSFGYIHGVAGVAHSEIDWTTALARLMASAYLREEFAISPTAVAKKLNVRARDRRAFVSLRPADVEAQAQQLRSRQSAKPFENLFKSGQFVLWSCKGGKRQNRNVLQAALDARARSQGGRERYYRLLTTTFGVRFSSTAEEAQVHPALAHLEIQPARVNAVVEVLETEGGHVLLDGIAPSSFCEHLDRVTPRIKTLLLQSAVQRHSYFVQIHAGVVSNGEKCLLLPAASGNGKTTLTAALTSAGFQYFSDEVALLEEPSLEVRPVPISLSVKSGALDVLAPLFPELRCLARHTREDFETVTYLNPPAGSFRYDLNRTYPVGWIVFPQYSPQASTELRPIGKAEALQRLMRESLAVATPLNKRIVRNLVQWIQRVECYELPNSSLQLAVQAIGGLLQP